MPDIKFNPVINGVVQTVTVSATAFTAMQEEATAKILRRTFVDNITFHRATDIIKDKVKGKSFAISTNLFAIPVLGLSA